MTWHDSGDESRETQLRRLYARYVRVLEYERDRVRRTTPSGAFQDDVLACYAALPWERFEAKGTSEWSLVDVEAAIAQSERSFGLQPQVP